MDLKTLLKALDSVETDNGNKSHSKQYAFSGSGSTRPMDHRVFNDPVLIYLFHLETVSGFWSVSPSSGGWSVLRFRISDRGNNFYFYWVGSYAYTGPLRDLLVSLGMPEDEES